MVLLCLQFAGGALLDAANGDILFEGPIHGTEDDELDEAHYFGSEINTVTELWHIGAIDRLPALLLMITN